MFNLFTKWNHDSHCLESPFSMKNVELFCALKYRFYYHFSSCGGAEMEVERIGGVVRLRVIPRSYHLCIGKEYFYISVP